MFTVDKKVKYLSILGQTVIDFILYSVQCSLLKDSGQIYFTVELGESYLVQGSGVIEFLRG